MEIIEIIKTLRSNNWRDRFSFQRKSELGQFFTPEWIKTKLHYMDPEVFTNPEKTIIDPIGCGIGDLLIEVIIKRLENNISYKDSISTIYGVDIDKDAIKICRERLLCGQEHLRPIVEKNIVCADALRYHYRFDGTDPYKTNKDIQFDRLFG
jgi:type I restriction-modification system DNA methylase subunit